MNHTNKPHSLKKICKIYIILLMNLAISIGDLFSKVLMYNSFKHMCKYPSYSMKIEVKIKCLPDSQR